MLFISNKLYRSLASKRK